MVKYFYSFVLIVIGGVSLYSFTQKKESKIIMSSNGFAVVELFTSEGCSSCPPADAAIADLQKEFPRNVYVLSFHVDYWNYLGWKDEFSNAAYTKRQQDYGEHFSLTSIYTPQAIVNGEKELVGSSKNQLHAIVEKDLSDSPDATIHLTAMTNKSTVTVDYNYSSREKSVINFALVQLQASSDVKRGENNGRKLHHINVVRDFKTTEAANGKINLSIPEGLTSKDVKVIAYVQEAGSSKVAGVTSVNL
jgi:hypothetical protein